MIRSDTSFLGSKSTILSSAPMALTEWFHPSISLSSQGLVSFWTNTSLWMLTPLLIYTLHAPKKGLYLLTHGLMPPDFRIPGQQSFSLDICGHPCGSEVQIVKMCPLFPIVSCVTEYPLRDGHPISLLAVFSPFMCLYHLCHPGYAPSWRLQWYGKYVRNRAKFHLPWSSKTCH